MKALIWFLSVYVLLLAGIPCPDSDCCLTHQATTSADTGSPSGDTHDHTAPCSPFCHCATCPGFTVAAPVEFRTVILSVITPIRSQLMTRYVMSFTRPHLGAVWQPPRA